MDKGARVLRNLGLGIAGFGALAEFSLYDGKKFSALLSPFLTALAWSYIFLKKIYHNVNVNFSLIGSFITH